MDVPPEPEEKAPFLGRLLLAASPFILLALFLGLDRCGGPGG
jgi:hypothetical protein